MVNLAADSWTKYWNFKLKSRKDSCPKKVVFIFCRNFAGDFFRRRRIFVDLKPNSERSLGPRPTFPFPGDVMGNIFWENSSESPDYAPRDVPRVQKIKRVSVSLQKSTLRIKIQCWFFLWRYKNASPLEISKKNCKNLFWFLTYKLSFAKNRMIF
jgi:hypothetical protein